MKLKEYRVFIRKLYLNIEFYTFCLTRILFFYYATYVALNVLHFSGATNLLVVGLRYILRHIVMTVQSFYG